MGIGYARVSKADGSQSLDLQHDALQAAGVDAVNVYHDCASGVRDDHSGLDSCVRALRKEGVDPMGPGRAVPGPRETPPPRPEQYGAMPHINSGILPLCPSIVRRHGSPRCPGRGTGAYAVNEESPSPIGPGAL